jgi:hypothetical protein
MGYPTNLMPWTKDVGPRHADRHRRPADFQDFRAKRDNKLINLTACMASLVRVPSR